jgi:RNA polymerase sigma factor (sigma-70 family)
MKNVRAYLFQTAANLATDSLRVESRRADLLTEMQQFLWSQDSALTPERIVIARHQVQHVREAIQGLSPLSRQIFYLSRFEGKSYQDIAALLGVPITEVETADHRGGDADAPRAPTVTHRPPQPLTHPAIIDALTRG